jgi:hypothetical protein
VIAVCLWLAHQAEAGEYRRLALADGRSLVGEVLVSGERGIEVRVPQGVMRVGFGDVLGMTPATLEEWRAQPTWRVLLGSIRAADGLDDAMADRAETQLRSSISHIPSVDVLPPLDAATARGLRACGLDLGCARSAVAARAYDVLVVGVVGIAGGATELSLASTWVAAPASTRRATALGAPVDAAQDRVVEISELEAAAAAILGLVPSLPGALASNDGPAPPAVGSRSNGTPARPFDHRLVYVPVPGLPAFAAEDPGRGLAAVSVALPMAGALTWAAGQSAQSPAEFAALTVGSFALSSVFANAVTAPR